jgi:2EXR family protein
VELQSRIWRDVAGIEAPRIIEVAFAATPTYRRPRGRGRQRRPAGVLWQYRCFERHVSPILQVSQGSRAEFIRICPDRIRLNNGPWIYFRASRDTIYFDYESFWNLYTYEAQHRPGLARPVPQWNLQGFPLVQTLGFYLPLGRDPNTVGLSIARDPTESALTGLTNIRMLGPRGYWPNWPAPSLAGPDHIQLKQTVRNKLRAILTNLTWRQRRVVLDEEGTVATDVNFFELLMAAPLPLPVGP